MKFKQHNSDRGLRWSSTNTTGARAAFSYTFISNSAAFRYSHGGTVSLRAVVYNDAREVIIVDTSANARTRSEADQIARKYFRTHNIRTLLATEAAKL